MPLKGGVKGGGYTAPAGLAADPTRSCGSHKIQPVFIGFADGFTQLLILELEN
jgi:hypothetical protein